MIFDATTRPWLTLLSKTSRNWKRSKDQNGRDFNSWKRGGWESNQWTNKWKSIGCDSTWEVYWKFERSTDLHFILRFIQNLLMGISGIDGMADTVALILVALAIADPCVKVCRNYNTSIFWIYFCSCVEGVVERTLMDSNVSVTMFQDTRSLALNKLFHPEIWPGRTY